MPRKRQIKKAAKQYWIGYCRKSTDTEDKQMYTLKDQSEMITRYYSELSEEERKSYPLQMKEESRSAFHVGRPVFNEMMTMADEGRIRGVIVVQPNRISRNHLDSGAFVHRLVEGKITYLDTAMGKRYTAEQSNDIFMLTLENAMSWKDSRDKGDRVREAMRKRAEEGKIMGTPMLGYRNICLPDGSKTIEVVKELAPKILRLFQLADTGTYSYAQLAKEANEMKLCGRKGAKLYGSSLEKMINHPMYKGWNRFDGILVKGTHEAIVPEELWNHVQIALEIRKNPQARPKNLELRELFHFGSLLSCPKCNHTLSPYRVKGQYVYYDCKNPQTKCKVRVKQEELVKQLEPLLHSIELTENNFGTLRKKLALEHKQSSHVTLKQREVANAEYEDVQKKIVDVFGQLGTAKELGIENEVKAHLEQLKQRKNSLQEQLNTSNETSNDWIDKTIQCFELFKLLQEAIIHGNARTREVCMTAIASNYSVEGEKLVCKLHSPLRQKAESDVHSQWWAGRV